MRLRRNWPVSDYAALGVCVVLVVVNAIFTPHFAELSNLWNILFQVSTVMLAALGMTFVIATGGVDLSVGSVMAISAAIAAVLLERGAVVAVVAAVVGATLIGILNGAVIASLRVQPIVVTLATLIGGRGLAQIISNNGELITISNVSFLEIGRGYLGPVPIQVIVALIAVGIAAFALRSMRFGRYVLAVGGNPSAARLSGVPVRATVVTVYALSAFLSGIAGVIIASRLGASDAAKIGQNMELDAISAVVVGGTALSGGRATIAGTVVGALLMQVIATSLNMLLVPYAWSLAIKAVIILVAVYLQRPARA